MEVVMKMRTHRLLIPLIILPLEKFKVKIRRAHIPIPTKRQSGVTLTRIGMPKFVSA